MKNNKKTILLSIVGILVMLLSIIGVTYAWFNANIEGKGSEFNVTTATVGPLTYSGSEITAENVLPGWISEDGILTVEGTVTTEDTVGYTCSIENTGSVTDVEYRISLDGEETSENAEWKSIEENPIVSGGISASNTSDEYKIAVRFKETGEDQNLQQNKTLSVNVVCEVKDMFTVTMVGVNGEVTPTEKAVVPNSNVEFEALPTEGYTASGATVTCDNGAVGTISNNIITISNVTNNNTCTVEYVLNSYNVSVAVNDASYATVNEPTNIEVTYGEEGTFTFTVATGYEYSSTSGCGNAEYDTSTNTLTITNITETLSCTVNFKIKTYEVEVSSTNTSYGTVTPTSTTVNYGSNATFTLSPKSGYKYSSNTCGGTVSGNTLTISNITAAKTCTVTFGYDATFTLATSGNYDSVNSATTGAACYYIRNYYGGQNYTPTTTTFSYGGYSNCGISETPTCKYTTNINTTSWTNGTSFDCASGLLWFTYGSGFWVNGSGAYYHAGCSATVVCSR